MKKNILAFTMKYHLTKNPTQQNMQISTLPKTCKNLYINNILSMIKIQIMEISTNIRKNQENQKKIEKILIDNNKIIFTRISDLDNDKPCNKCKRQSIYVDTESKYYCWFHRSEVEK